MRIAVVIPEFHKLGGTERCVAGVAEALARRGHTLVIFAHRRDPSIVPQARWYRVPMLPRPHLPRFLSFLMMNSVSRMWARVAHGERFDVIFSTGPDVLRPTITTFHCTAAGFADELATSNGTSALRRWNNVVSYRAISSLEKYVVRKGAGRVVSISGALSAEVSGYYGVPPEKLVIVPDGVDVSEFHPPSPEERSRSRAALGIAPEKQVVMFAGHNWERKGLLFLVDALAQLREAAHLRPLLLVAGGLRAPKYEDEIKRKLGEDVRFLGVRGDMAALYAASDVLALPTLHEPFGLPVLEAMACGLPVIVSRLSGVAELITPNVTGLLLENPRDVSEVADKLKTVLSDPGLRQRLGASARGVAEKYSWDAIGAKFEQLCRELAREG